MAEEVKEVGDVGESKEIKEGKLWAVFAYLGPLCLLPLLNKKDNKFALHHAKQGLVLFVGELIAFIVFLIPFIGQFILVFLGRLIGLIFGIYSIIGIIQSLIGKYWKAPIISKWAENISV